MTNTTLLRALHDPGDPPCRPLPTPVDDLLLALAAPPRLAAHLRVVHDVAHQLVMWTEQHHPELPFDREAVLFGAATHDIGKVVHAAELSGPGSAHEEAGRELLLAHGVRPELARFAGTHAAWTDPGIQVEDLLVSTADKVWKNKRVPELENLLVARLSAASGQPAWEVFLALDEALERIGDGATHRLAFQSAYPVHG
ncbi:HD domain-containing protein [Streptacidiphilus albus]|uniref:HD domain-containing protein n=1 Tax=Streptacidiphilus albus TaxID=105425 RepID=UPI0005A8878B|nr:HD domain-containing protein [Streptacidiphilus albus]